MTAPTVVDLSLPSDQELMAAASPSPEAEAARVTRGNPGQISGLGRQLQSAGSDLEGVYALSMRTQRALTGSFTNDGAPVYDEQVHRQLLPRGFQDAGTRLHDVGRRLGVVAEELSSAIGAVNVALDGLRSDLQRRRDGLAAEVDAARATGESIPVAAVAALQKRRAAVAREMQELVDTCGRVVAGRVARYDEVLGGCLPVIGELGRTVGVGPDRLGGAVDTSGTRINSLLGGRLEASSPAPPLPTVEIFPTPESRLPDRGFTPAPTGPGPLITLPAPDLGTAVQDGRGSGQRANAPGVMVDRATGFDPGSSRQGTPTDRLKEQVDDPTLEAARREMQGEVVARRSDGQPYDHVTKVRQGQRGLVNRIIELQRGLGDTRTTESERRALDAELSEASRLLDHTEESVPRT